MNDAVARPADALSDPRATRRRRLLGIGAAGLLLGRSGTGLAQSDWPNKPIRFVVGFAPGGPTDSFARLLAKRLTEQLGQPVSIENRVGANANIAAELVARSAPDGSTFLYNSSSMAISASLYKDLKYDARRDLMPVGLVMGVPIAFVVHPSLPVTSPAELIAYLKSKPRELNYASGGVGNAQHLGMEMVLQHFGLEASHIAYKGSAPAHIDLIAGRTQMMIDTVGSVMPYILDKRLRPIATLSAQRVGALPAVPTMRESGMPGFELAAWYGVMAPARTPEAIVRKLNAEIDRAMKTDELRAAVTGQGGQSLAAPPEAYDTYLQTEIARYAKVIRALNVKPE